MSEIKKSGSKRIDSFQALRGIAFLGIAASHCSIALLGPWSVSIFFVLSGFVLMYSYQNRDINCGLKDNFLFSIKRIEKLYPLYFISTVVMIILNHQYSANIIATNLLLIQSWFPKSGYFYSLNGVAWFYSDMLFIYFMFPLIKKAIDKYKSKKNAYTIMLAVTLAVSAVSIVLKITDPQVTFSDSLVRWLTYILPVSRLADFVVGCNLCYLVLNSDKELSKIKATLLEILAVLLLVGIQLVYYKNAMNDSTDFFPYFYIPNSALVVYLFYKKQGFITKLCTNKLLVYIGNLSGITYLVHIPVKALLYNVFPFSLPGKLHDLTIFVLSIVITIAISEIYNRLSGMISKKIHNK